jgi:molybdate transport system substrate-binding protein
VWCLASLLAVLSLTAAAPRRLAARDVRVSAAVSLTDALQEIAKGFEAAGGPRVVFNFGPSNALARQIAEGAPADLFISADAAQMQVLVRSGAARSDEIVSLLSNVLAVVVARDSTVVIKTVEDLLNPGVRRIALGSPDAVPAGVYAKQYLEKAGLWTRIRPRLVPTRSARAALAAVEAAAVDAAIVYRTDARAARRSRVAFEIPRDQGPAIVYAAVVLPRAPGAEAARRLLAHLRSPAARAIFAKHGFIPL